jgi:LAO/AO transport system kinase
MSEAPAELVARVLAGEVRAGARVMRALDDQQPGAEDVLRALYASTGRAFVLGVTGNPGAGKSTVVDALIAHYRKEGRRVGVVAVDPSSPFSGGAILGDRIRMQRHATDPDVFIRSLATRGHLGGLSRSTGDVVSVLDAMGYDVVIVETVGVGQDEVDVVSQADTCVVVTVPGLGDEIQAIKAGILEIADVLCVNKADREGADRTVRDLTGMLELRGHELAPVEIVRTVATSGKGIDELANAVERHRERDGGKDRAARRQRRARATVREIVLDRVRARLDEALDEVATRLEAVAERKADPYTVAAELLRDLRERSGTP